MAMLDRNRRLVTAVRTVLPPLVDGDFISSPSQPPQMASPCRPRCLPDAARPASIASRSGPPPCRRPSACRENGLSRRRTAYMTTPSLSMADTSCPLTVAADSTDDSDGVLLSRASACNRRYCVTQHTDKACSWCTCVRPAGPAPSAAGLQWSSLRLLASPEQRSRSPP